MNTAPDKKKSVEKIDDMVALLMAVGILLGDETAVYNETEVMLV